MAVKTAYVMFQGQKITAILNEETGLYEATVTAPAESSWSQANHVYLAEVHAEDDAGNAASVDSTDKTYGDQLKIRVLEKTKPTVVIASPTAGSVLGANTQTIDIRFKDEGGSGLNEGSIVFKVNGTAVPLKAGDADGYTLSDSGKDPYIGYRALTYVAKNLPDGSNTIEFTVTDNDGNVSDTAKTTFIISTAAPTLDVTTPTDNLLTNSAKLTVSGTAAPGSENVTLATVTVNGTEVTVGEGGAFSTEVTLTEGTNTITVVATDSLGKATTVTRTVTLDTKAPVITDIVTTPTTVDSGKTFKITFKVVDADPNAGADTGE